MGRFSTQFATFGGSVLLLFSLAAHSVAAEHTAGGRGLRGDADGDQALSVEEFLADSGRRFERYDDDHDGVVSRAEVEKVAQQAARRIEARLLSRLSRDDRDGDGRLTRAEADAAAASRFAGLDSDGDGKVVRSDFRRMPRDAAKSRLKSRVKSGPKSNSTAEPEPRSE